MAPSTLSTYPLPIYLGQWGLSLQATLGQGGRDHIMPREGFPVSKRDGRETDKELARGVKTGNCALAYTVLSICICVYSNCVNAANNLMCLGYK